MRQDSRPKLVVLDRDGTINEECEDFIQKAEDWVPIEGSLEAIARLNRAGWTVVIASNQPGLERGLIDMSLLNAVHEKMHKAVVKLGGRVDAIFFCPHSPESHCECRKPEPGMLIQIASRYGVQLEDIHMVGDRLTDVQAAVAAGCNPHLVLTGRGAMYKSQPLPPTFPPHTHIHDNLAAFAEALLQTIQDPQ